MSDAHSPFKRAVEARDLDALGACFTPEAVFHSPVTYRPFEGRQPVMTVLSAVMEMFEDFSYNGVLDGGGTAALFFDARVGDREIEGVDHLKFGPDGLITELTVMIRPLSGLNAVAEDMGRRLAGP
jgi:hypothetical protein